MRTSNDAKYNFFTFISQQITGSIVTEACLFGNNITNTHLAMIILTGKVTLHKEQPVNQNKTKSMATKLGERRPRPISSNKTHCVTDCQEVKSGKGIKYKNGKRISVARTQFLNPLFSFLHSKFHAFAFFPPLFGKCTQWNHMKNNFFFLISQLRNYLTHLIKFVIDGFILEVKKCDE